VPCAPLAKTSFEFKKEPLFKIPSELYKPTGIPLINIAPTNGFKLNLPKNPFTSETNLFRKNPVPNPFLTQQVTISKVEKDNSESDKNVDDEEDKLEPEVKEKVQASS
jgi:hypothetical protein